jgi:hypothetical protein
LAEGVGGCGRGFRRIGQNGWQRRESGIGRHEGLGFSVFFFLGQGSEFGGGAAILGFLQEFVAVALLVFGELGNF